MAKPRSLVVDYAAYLVLRLAVCILHMLTDRAAESLARGLAWLGYRLDRRHRRVADDNIRHAFPELSPARRDRLVRATFRHFTALAFDLARLPRKLHAGNCRQRITFTHLDIVPGWMAAGRPMMLISGHLGNWEVAGYSAGLFGYQMHAVARPLDNPFVNDFLRRFRERTGQRVLAKQGDAQRTVEILKAGGILGTLVDQDAGPRGLFVDFFGRPASTHKAIARMALAHDVQLVVVGVFVTAPMRFQLVVEDVIEPSEYVGRPDAAREITQRFTSAIERLVRRHPEQYFWLHRRWKHQPTAPVKDALRAA